MGPWFLRKHALRLLLTVAAAGFFGAAVVRMAPAFGVTEQELDPRLHRETVEAIRGESAPHTGIIHYYAGYLGGILKGDFGFSPSLNRPVRELLRERIPVSLRNLVPGTLLGVSFGMGLAAIAVVSRSTAARFFNEVASGVLLAIPSAALALLFLIAGWPGPLALAAVVFPRVYRYTFASLSQWADAPHVIAARARGLSKWRVLFRHTIPMAAPQLLAVLGMAVSIGFPALVPIESVCDSAGIGQLAWKAALARDLPVLVSLTMVAAVIVSIGNAAADASADALRRRS